MTFCQDHLPSIEANNREAPRDVKDDLNYTLANLGVGIVELRSVVPCERRSVISVIQIPSCAIVVVPETEDDSGV